MLFTHNDENHADGALASHEEGSTCQDEDGYWDSNDCEDELSIKIYGCGNHNEKLDGESKEEKEVELQEGDVDLQQDGQGCFEDMDGTKLNEPGRSDSGASCAGLR